MGSAAGGEEGPRERIEGVRVPCWDAKRRVRKAIELLERERKTTGWAWPTRPEVGKSRGPLPAAEDLREVSTERQEKEQTVDSQLDAFQRAARAGGYEVAPSHVFVDERRSGAHLDRPGLDRLRYWLRPLLSAHLTKADF